MRLDPRSLPVRFTLPGSGLGAASAPACETEVQLDETTAVVTRRQCGTARRLAVPICQYRGVAARVQPSADTGGVSVTLELLHEDSTLSLVLMEAHDMDDVVADWQAWARRLRLGLLMIEPDGSVRDIAGPPHRAQVGTPGPRRRCSVLRGRRPRFLIRRKTGMAGLPVCHAGEREIIART